MKLPKGIGKLRHRVVIEILTNATDNQGGQATTWATHATVWANVEPISARERQFAGQIQYQRTHKCTIRYLSTVTSAMRILFDSRYFQIKGVRLPDEQKFLMLLDLEENQGT